MFLVLFYLLRRESAGRFLIHVAMSGHQESAHNDCMATLYITLMQVRPRIIVCRCTSPREFLCTPKDREVTPVLLPMHDFNQVVCSMTGT